jgi:hypothetical protein
MYRNIFLTGLLGLCMLAGCIVAPKYSDIPEIKFEGLNKNIVDQGRVRDDSIMITISFTDGDGDIGDEKNKANIFMIDNRDGKMITYSMPMIPQKGTANGVAGTITILHTTLFNVCCYYKNGGDPCTIPAKPTTDTVKYKLYIEDRSGHKSNTLDLEPVIINCK